MYYERLKEMNINCKDHRNALIDMGFLTEENKNLSCWCMKNSQQITDFENDPMLPNRFWISIKDDMLYVCESSFGGKVLGYWGNIELKNLRFVQKKFYSIVPCYVFEINNENGTHKFRIIPTFNGEDYYAQEISKHIVRYNSKKEDK